MSIKLISVFPKRFTGVSRGEEEEKQRTLQADRLSSKHEWISDRLTGSLMSMNGFPSRVKTFVF